MNTWIIIIIVIVVVGYWANQWEKKETGKQDRIDDLENRINDIEEFIGLDEESLKIQKEFKIESEMSELANNLSNEDKNK